MQSFVRRAAALFDLPESVLAGATGVVLERIAVLDPGLDLGPLRFVPPAGANLHQQLQACGLPPLRCAPFVTLLLNHLRQRHGPERISAIVEADPELARYEQRPGILEPRA